MFSRAFDNVNISIVKLSGASNKKRAKRLILNITPERLCSLFFVYFAIDTNVFEMTNDCQVFPSRMLKVKVALE